MKKKGFANEEDWESRKEFRRERKRMMAKDRSKFKKTDLDKRLKKDLEKPTPHSSLSKGRVLSMTAQGALVEVGNTTYLCHLRGALKKEKTQFKTLVTVGDFVFFSKISPDEGVIEHVEARKSYLVRSDALDAKKQQILAANIDQVLITVSLISPPLKVFLIDRYILATKKGNMEPVVVLNKIDLLHDRSIDATFRRKEKELYETCVKTYESFNIPFVGVSAKTGEGIDQLKLLMKGKASVFSGQSGSGKTSLINTITGLDLKVGDIVDKTRKGSHTTTQAHLLHLDFDGWCIDTPGIKSFGFWQVTPNEVESYFSEIHEIGKQCKFRNCLHSGEEGCAVKEAAEENNISALRYSSYLSLLDSLNEDNKRR